MAAPMVESKFPVQHKIVQREIGGIPTDIVCQNFSNKIFIVISQYEKIGTMVEVIRDVALQQTKPVTYTTRVLLGEDVPLHHVIARSLVSRLAVTKPVVVGFALKDTSRETTQQIEEIVIANAVWS